jgi:hypothetical protein
MRRVVPAIALIAALAAAAPAAGQGGGPLTAERIRLDDRAATVRVVVELSGGQPVQALEGQVEALDPTVSDGAGAVQLTQAGARTTAPPVQRLGLRVSVARRPDRLVVLIRGGARDRFAFLSYATDGTGTRLVIDLWKNTTSRRAARLDDGCLRLTAWAGGRGRASARGLELVPLFEHGLVLSLDDDAGRRLGLRAITATEGVFLPDFSGYQSPGRWRGSVPYSVSARQRAMLRAWSTSARDGALECLVQVPVLVRPRT